MNKNIITIVGIIAIGALLFFKGILGSSPEDIILKRLDNLAEIIQVRPQDGNLTKAAHISGFSGYFTQDASVNLRVQNRVASAESRGELVEKFKMYKTASQVRAMTLQWDKEDAEFNQVSNNEIQVKLDLDLNYNGQSKWFFGPINMTFKKSEGSWRISSMKNGSWRISSMKN